MKIKTAASILALALIAAVPSAHAEAAKTAAPAAAAHPAHVATAAAASRPAQAVTSAEGVIQALDIASATPNLTLTVGANKQTFVLDRQSTKVLQSNKAAELSALKVGESVMVRYQTVNGKSIAKSVEIRA